MHRTLHNLAAWIIAMCLGIGIASQGLGKGEKAESNRRAGPPAVNKFRPAPGGLQNAGSQSSAFAVGRPVKTRESNATSQSTNSNTPRPQNDRRLDNLASPARKTDGSLDRQPQPNGGNRETIADNKPVKRNPTPGETTGADSSVSTKATDKSTVADNKPVKRNPSPGKTTKTDSNASTKATEKSTVADNKPVKRNPSPGKTAKTDSNASTKATDKSTLANNKPIQRNPPTKTKSDNKASSDSMAKRTNSAEKTVATKKQHSDGGLTKSMPTLTQSDWKVIDRFPSGNPIAQKVKEDVTLGNRLSAKEIQWLHSQMEKHPDPQYQATLRKILDRNNEMRLNSAINELAQNGGLGLNSGGMSGLAGEGSHAVIASGLLSTIFQGIQGIGGGMGSGAGGGGGGGSAGCDDGGGCAEEGETPSGSSYGRPVYDQQFEGQQSEVIPVQAIEPIGAEEPVGGTLPNPAPRAIDSRVVPTPIQIVNPEANGATLSYTLDGRVFRIEPGTKHELSTGAMVVFDRGTSAGQGRYTLRSGTYTFAATDDGWDLYHTEE